jgi:16S rRNA processing protein RimM
VEVLTDRPAERFRPGAVLHPEGSAEPLTIATAAEIVDGPGWRLTFREVPDRTAAERLRGAYLEAIVGAGTALRRGEYFWHEVIGAAVRGVDGTDLGHVEDVYRVAETEVLVVRGGPPGEFDLPVVRSLIRVFAPRRGEIVVDADALDLPGPGTPRDADGPRPHAPRRRSGSRRPAAVAARPAGGQDAADSTIADPTLPVDGAPSADAQG